MPLDQKKLAALYEEGGIVQAILDLLSEKKIARKISYLDRIDTELKARGAVYAWRELIAAFKSLEEAGCGKYVKSSKGYRARFEWETLHTKLAGIATGSIALIDPADDGEDGDDDDADDQLRHAYQLRPHLALSILLPTDLSETEAERLAQFADSLSFMAPYGDDDDDAYSDEDIVHQYVLRPSRQIELSLPENLTPKEAGRLGQFIRTLSFEDA